MRKSRNKKLRLSKVFILSLLAIVIFSACTELNTVTEDLIGTQGVKIVETAKEYLKDSLNEVKQEVSEDTEESQEQEWFEIVDALGPYNVVRVVDGDTIIVNIDGSETRVRFIGVDTPESVHTDSSRNVEEGITASDYTKNLLSEKSVYLEYDVGEHDKYGRTLAYVYTEDGTMVNKLLLKEGLAKIMTIQPNVKYAEEFLSIQNRAQEDECGFWADYFLQ